VLQMIPEGTEVRVLAGPVTAADGSRWWQVIVLDATGYIVEDFLALSLDDSAESDPEADPTPAPPTPTGEPILAPAGPGLGQVANADGDDVRLRSEPGYDAPVLRMIPEGTTLEILDGPTVVADGSRWWHVVALGITGYMVEDFLVAVPDVVVVPAEVADATPSPTMAPTELATVPPTPTVAATESVETPEASDTEPVSVEAIAENVAVVPGQNVRFRYRVTNSAQVDVMVQLSVSNSLDGWGAHILAAAGEEEVDSPVLIPAGGAIIVTVEVTVPPEARVQQQNTTTLIATALIDAVAPRPKAPR
jgi:hypothetical protein